MNGNTYFYFRLAAADLEAQSLRESHGVRAADILLIVKGFSRNTGAAPSVPETPLGAEDWYFSATSHACGYRKEGSLDL